MIVRLSNAPSQRGFSVVLVLLVLMLGGIAVGLTFNRPTGAGELADDTTTETFSTVKAALIGHAARQGVFQCRTPADAAACLAELNASPKLGEFPCPDTNNDGLAEAACATQTLGRVPWRTLGIPEPKDSAGETLWYAVSILYLGNASNPITKDWTGRVTGGAINSSTPGTLTVRGADGSAQTSTAVAVIFSPGAAIAGQRRSATQTAACTGMGTVAMNLCPANYLETSGTTNNAAIGGPFINGAASANFNDRLIEISASDVMPLLEMRLGAELRALLLAYKYNSDCFCYPWADSWNYSGGIADIGVNRGRFPSTAEPQDWGTGTIPRFPAWLKDNDWHNQVYYSASKRETASSQTCFFCSSSLDITVKATPSAGSPTVAAGAVVLTPGTPQGAVRPFLPSQAVLLTDSMTAAMNVFGSYFEDADNNNKGACYGNLAEHADSVAGVGTQTAVAPCDVVVRPQSRAYDRDRLFMIERESPATICGPAGEALLRNAPCHTTGNNVSAVCSTLASKLAQCSATCAAAAQDMLEPPCRNTLNSNNCVQPIAALSQCTQ